MVVLTFRKDAPQKKKRVKEYFERQMKEHQKEVIFIGENKNVYEVLIAGEIKPLSQWEFGKKKVLTIKDKDLMMLIKYFSSCNECAICFIGN